jgi:2-polyprenyl-3-methyl-5-hydroxy-6-metoxy-1,4-benzoquinol methylase
MSVLATALMCPACGRSDWRPDLVAGEHRLVRCRCGLRALDAPFDATAALTANEEKYGGEGYNTWYRSMRDILQARYERDCAEIEKVVATTRSQRVSAVTAVTDKRSKGALLDVGCAYGWFLEVARERGWDVTGVEATPETANVARQAGLDVHVGTLEDAAYSDASFDVVCLWDVLEHVPGVDAFLGEIRRILKPGGLLAVQSPNIRSVMARQAGERWSWLLLPHHVWHFTPATMKQTLEKRGFAVARLTTWEPPEAFVNDLQLYKRHPRLGSKAVRRITDKPLALAEKAWCKTGFGGLVRVLARRTP